MASLETGPAASPADDPPFTIETLADATDRRSLLIKRLNSAAIPTAVSLMTRLLACTYEAPCRSGACPVCLRAFRLRLIDAAEPLLKSGRILQFSWIPPDSLVVPGNLGDFHLGNFQQRMLRALQRVLPHDSLLVGGVDASLNFTENILAGWQLHVNCLMATMSSAVVTETIQALLALPRAEGSRGMQIQIKTDNELPCMISYTFKAGFYRRSRYRDVRRTTGRPFWNTRAQRLDARSAVDIALALNRFPIGQRLLLVGLRRVGPSLNFDLHPTG